MTQAEPVGGGQLVGSGRMWLSPAALNDPRAVRISMEAQGLPTEAIVKRYMPPVWLLLHTDTHHTLMPMMHIACICIL